MPPLEREAARSEEHHFSARKRARREAERARREAERKREERVVIEGREEDGTMTKLR